MKLFRKTYSRSLSKATVSDPDHAYQVVQELLMNLRCDQVEVQPTGVHFKNALFNDQGSNHLMVAVDEGWVKLDLNKHRLLYKVSYKRFMYINLGIIAFFTVVTWHDLAITLPFFLFILFILNPSINMLRHYFFAGRPRKLIVQAHEQQEEGS